MTPRPTASSAEPPSDDGRERTSISKYLSRMKTALTKGGDSNPRRKSASAPARVKPTVELETQVPVVESAPDAPAPEPEAQSEGVTKIPRYQIHEERARKLGARYGLEIQPSEWHSAEGDVLRVKKEVRIRIHRECHNCNSNFGIGNECPKCHHVRCRKCTRHPPTRTEAEKQANHELRDVLVERHKEMAPIIPHYNLIDRDQLILTRPPRTAGGQPLVFKRPTMRSRRHCHRCDSLFNPPRNTLCQNCGHKRCADCPRQPDDREKYPYGYPGDEPGEQTPRLHRCHECRFKFSPNAEDGTMCLKCAHKKCPDCPRVKPRKVQPVPDPYALRGIGEHIEGLRTLSLS